MRFMTPRKKVFAALMIAGFAAGSALTLHAMSNSDPVTATSPAATAPSAALPDLTTIVDRSAPAVVNIAVTGRPDAGPQVGIPGPDKDNPFGEFFKRFPFPGPMPNPDDTPSQGRGSGFVVSPDGYIVTNHHVVANADKITVRLDDRREFDARLVGSDKQTDVALLKIDATNLPAVKLGNSDVLKVGQWVVAIGAPFGLERSATQGIVSALSRSLPGDQYVPFIQTDVAVNPGNSGGPLFDLAGQVVGINSQIYSRTGGYMGLSFAIPINTAMNVVQQLKTEGRVERGWLGVVMQSMNQDLARSLGAKEPVGALVSQVNEGSPAAEAGMKVGDIIIAYNGKPITDSGDLPPLVGTTKPGQTVPMTVIRDGKERTLDVKVGSFPESGEVRLAQAEEGAQGARLNLSVSELTPEQRKQMEVSGGVLVKDVGPGPARSAGVRPGDVIVQVDNQEVKNVAQLRKIIKQLPEGKTVPILVKRGDGALFLALSVPAARG